MPAAPVDGSPDPSIDAPVGPAATPSAATADQAAPPAAAAAILSWRLVLWLIGVGAVLALSGYLATPLVLGVRVTTVATMVGPIVQTIVASGRVESPDRVSLGAQITGTVAEVRVEVGAEVTQGDTLIVLDDRDVRAQVDQAQAALHQARTQLDQLGALTLPAARQANAEAQSTLARTRAQYDRVVQLAEKGFATTAALDDARNAYQIANAQARSAALSVASASPGGGEQVMAQAAQTQAQAALRMVQARLDLTRVTAPATGRVITRTVEPGAIAQPGTVLMVLAPTGTRRLVLQIDERNLSLIRIDLPALASADAYPDLRFPARVVLIHPAVDADRGSVEVKLDVPDAPDYLLEDMTVSVDIEVARRADALLLPSGAVRDAAGDAPHVLAVVDGRTVDRPVTLGARSLDMLEILTGLTAGDQVVPAFTAAENVMMPLLLDRGWPSAAMRVAAGDLLARFGLEKFAERPAGALSGGQQQRVAIARALAMQPALVLADEPTGNLDTKSADDALAQMRAINRDQGTAFLIVTHNLDLARRTDRIIEIVDGRLTAAGA